MGKNLLKLLIIPLFIAAIYFVLQAFLLVNRFGVFSIVEEASLSYKKTNQRDVHLLKNQKVSATFKASDDNLGILFVQLVKFGQGGDQVVFRIKREGEEKWYHESTFSGGQVKNDQYFPLGFPPITNSKNNIYVFEIESLAGEYNNGVGVIKDKPTAVMYKYSAGDMKNYKTLLSFTYKKFLYVLKNINYWQVTGIFIVSFLIILFIKRKNITVKSILRFFKILKKNPREALKIIINNMKSDYLSLEKKIVKPLKKATYRFTSIKFYLQFFNTNTKKRLAVGILLFLLALIYRFSSTLVNQHLFFYAGLGGQGDYDQFIRAATCALNFCSYAILGQNFLIGTSILGAFYEIFGFTGGLKAYLYLMLLVSSIVATLPHFLLSRKSWITLGGIIGSLYLATSDSLTNVALNFPPDNGSLFTFSMFFVVYLLTLNIGTIRWLLFFGLMGLVDGLNKALFLISDLATFLLFIPVFLFEKTKRINKFPFVKFNSKLIFYSVLPLLIFVLIYSVWEYIVYIKFSAPYFLRGLVLSRGESYITYTAFDNGSLAGGLLLQFLNLSISAIVMIKRLIQYADLPIIFLAPIFFGMLFFSFMKLPHRTKFPIIKFIVASILSIIIVALLTFIKNDYFNIHQIFAGEYIIDNWTDQTYIGIFLFSEIILLFILNLKYSAIKVTLPIIPYVVMLIILTKNSPFPRISTHVVAWVIILFGYLIDWLLMNTNTYTRKGTRIMLASVFIILLVFMYTLPKTTTMIMQLRFGFAANQNQTRYLQWVEESLPPNAVILAGGKSDLVILAENVKRPIIYNTLWSAAVLIRPKEIPGISPTDFSLVNELQNKDNFKKNKYVILEDDIYLWRARLTGVADNVFSTNLTTLRAEDYSITVYKFNPTLKKAIYELIFL